MIKVTRLNGTEMMVNSDLIEIMEETPDTVISLITGRKLVVKESVEVLRSRVIAFRQACNKGSNPYYGMLTPHPQKDLKPEDV